ncbi:MAG: CTP synthase [Defluviitaleaceae bacterium]|nr:CTP synthase [Defluviitaleaceae bacterium]MCL2275212.1 CTP synthase [Defluviitaleaceae bacterium]
MQTKYIFMTGGVCSGLGKGITAASLGRLLKARGFRVTIQKFDPYLNTDPGLLSPYEHGEVYVTEDGAEVDLDLGHYERYIDENLSVNNSITAGQIFWEVLSRERNGNYRGKTIQIIPHITDAVKSHIVCNQDTQIVISEIGGTVGDFESLPFIEAIRQFGDDIGAEHIMFVHVTLVPYLDFAGEAKTKPSQHSVKELLSLGIKPDVLVCRTQHPLEEEMRDKLARFCHVKHDCIIENLDAKSLYDVPLMLEKEHFADIVCKRLGLTPNMPDLSEWTALTQKSLTKTINVALVGKYAEFKDAYISSAEALKHASIFHGVKINIDWIHAEEINDENAHIFLADKHAVIMPGGYGERGIGGLISAAKYARVNKKPFLAIGQAMHCALIEYARNVAGCTDSDSVEFNAETVSPIIIPVHPPQEGKGNNKIVPMRKGAIPVKLTPDTLLAKAYGENLIYERFRHNYKINIQCRIPLAESGLILSASSPDDAFCEAIELPNKMHPWFVGVQFRPEFKSRITRPSPIFKAFIKAALGENLKD